MAGFDMPACDAARRGGPAGWALYTASLDYGLGVAIQGYPDGDRVRHAIRGASFGQSIAMLNDWASRKGWERHGIR